MGRAETIYRRTLADIRGIVKDYETDDQFCMSDFSIERGESVSKREMTMIQNMLNKDYEKLQWNHKRGFVTDEQYMFQEKVYDAMQRTIDKARKFHLGEAYNAAALMNVRNQLMNKLGDDFNVMGGSTTPKIIVTPNKYKDISFEITSNGQNMEMTPVVGNVPDYLHKIKGIAYMQAANTLYQVIMDTLKSVKKENVGRKDIMLHIKEDYSEIFTPRALRSLRALGFKRYPTGDGYWMKEYPNGTTVQIGCLQGKVTVYDPSMDIIPYDPKYVTRSEDIEDLDTWAGWSE